MEDDMSYSIRSERASRSAPTWSASLEIAWGVGPGCVGMRGRAGRAQKRRKLEGHYPFGAPSPTKQGRMEGEMSYSLGWGAEISKGRMSSPGSETGTL